MLEAVTAKVRYLNPEWKGRDEMPEIGDRESRRANTQKHEVEVHDARGLSWDLDESGFVLATHESEVGDFHDDGHVATVYYPEVSALVARLTGADEVIITQHVVRTEDTSDFNKAYARFVHCDYSATDPLGTARGVLSRTGTTLDESKTWDFAWYNTWQPIEREVQNNPLAMVDIRSLDTGDVVDYYFSGYGKPLLTAMPVYNPDHRLYYFPLMQTNELLVLKQLDSRPGRALSCPHTSFDLDSPGPLGRRSIEVRMMCAFARS